MTISSGLAAIALLSLAILVLSSIKERPEILLWLYVLNYSRFWGFLNPEWVQIRGLVNVVFVGDALMLAAAIVSGIQTGGLRIPRQYRALLLMVLLMMTWGTLIPFLRGESSVMRAFVDGKGLISYGGLLFMLTVASQKLVKHALWISCSTGLMLGISVIGAAFLNLALPGHEPLNESLGPRSGIHVYSSMFIGLAAVVYFIRLQSSRFRIFDLGALGLLAIALLLQGHRSVLVATLATCGAFLLLRPGVKRITRFVAIMPIIAGMAVFAVPPSQMGEVFLGTITEIANKDGAVGSRISYNRFRVEAIKERPFFGFGFIDEESELGQKIAWHSLTPFDETLGTVDAGYIDLLVRFGFVGTGLFILFLLRALMPSLHLREHEHPLRQGFCLFLLSYFGISFTWSPWTYSFGIIPMALVFLIISVMDRTEKTGTEEWGHLTYFGATDRPEDTRYRARRVVNCNAATVL